MRRWQAFLVTSYASWEEPFGDVSISFFDCFCKQGTEDHEWPMDRNHSLICTTWYNPHEISSTLAMVLVMIYQNSSLQVPEQHIPCLWWSSFSHFSRKRPSFRDYVVSHPVHTVRSSSHRSFVRAITPAMGGLATPKDGGDMGKSTRWLFRSSTSLFRSSSRCIRPIRSEHGAS